MPGDVAASSRPKHQQWRSNSALVYFVQSGDESAIKIGVAEKTEAYDTLQQAMEHRMRKLQTFNHTPLKLLAVRLFTEGLSPVGDAYKAEAELHNRFDNLRIFRRYTPGGEWFRVDPELITHVRQENTNIKDLGFRRSVCVAPQP